MHHLKWSDREKKLCRQVYDSALERELAETVAEFKRLAAQVATAVDMWPLQEFLHRRQRDIDYKYDYRYSQLPMVFGRLLREGRIKEEALAGLSEDKLAAIRLHAGL